MSSLHTKSIIKDYIVQGRCGDALNGVGHSEGSPLRSELSVLRGSGQSLTSAAATA